MPVQLRWIHTRTAGLNPGQAIGVSYRGQLLPRMRFNSSPCSMCCAFFTKGESLERHTSRPQDVRPPTKMSESEFSEERITSQLDLPMAWVDAAVVANHLGVDVSYVYEHAGELGARRLGNGPKPRLRFRLDLVDHALLPTASGHNDANPLVGRTQRPGRRHAASSRSVPLLPIRPRRTGSY